MLKKTIEYVDYNGTERKEDFYFNLTEAELAEMELTTEGGMENMINRIIAAQDNASLVKLFKDLIYKSYGVKSDDGKRFIKNAGVFAEFSQTEAYSKLFMELATDEKAASDFVNGILPPQYSQAPEHNRQTTAPDSVK